MYFPKYRRRKTCLDKCLKSRVSEDRYTENMENRSKQYSNLSGRTFLKLIKHCERGSIGKGLF